MKKRILDLLDDASACEIYVTEDMIPYENKEKYKNAVLIAPAAFTNKGISETFWEKLVAELKKRGYEVYCNSGGLHYDQVINGSIELLMSTKELILNASFFRHVVAVRRGFNDLVSKTNAKLSVLRLGGTLDMPLRVEYGSRDDDVGDLGRIDDILPVLYCADREDEILEDIDGKKAI